MLCRLSFVPLAALAALLLPLSVSAAEPSAVDLDEDEDDAVALDEEPPAEDLVQDTEEGQNLDAPVEEAPAEEDEEASTYLIGVRYRAIVVPKFLINMFGVDGAATLGVSGVGPEFAINQKDFEVVLSGWYAGYGLSPTPFKGPNDGDEAWEIIESNLHQIYLTADFSWKHHLSSQWDFTLGAGAGIGIVFGDLWRNEAYWNGTDAAGIPYSPAYPGDPYTNLAECPAANVPNSIECPIDGEYRVNGPAEAWPVYPWLTFQTGLRYSPVKQFVGRLDIGVGSSGFWLGLGADYGL